jgi:hypothetical protein
MSEVAFDRLLDAVSMAIAPEQELAHLLASDEAREAANDNETVWPLFPFPQGWYAAC